MSIYLNELSVSNLRSIDKEKNFKFGYADLNILDGPNGYGKSTIFDAIELLIMGGINHFNENLKNRGNIELRTVANNSKRETIIRGEFKSNSEIFAITRIFDWDKNENRIILDDNEGRVINEAELLKKLGISKYMFDLGMYISQSESLNFLEKKYGARKDILTSILESDAIVYKNEKVKEIRDLLKKENKEIYSKLNKRKENLEKRKEEIEKQNSIDITVEYLTQYQRLFPDVEYEFDKEKINLDITCNKVLSDLQQIKAFIEDYEKFTLIKRNKEIHRLINIPESEVKAFFYREELAECREHKKLYKDLEAIEEIFNGQKLTKSHLDDVLLAKYLDVDCKAALKILQQKEELEKGITSLNREILNLLEKRDNLKHAHSSIGILPEEQCPFCGEILTSLDSSYLDLTEFIRGKIDFESQQLNNVNIEWDTVAKNILEKAGAFLNENTTRFELYKKIKNLLNIEIKNIRDIEKFKKLSAFKYRTEENKENDFDYFYNHLKQILQSLITPQENNLSTENMTVYEKLNRTYFNNNRPQISIQEIDDKIMYVQKQYSNQSIQLLSEIDKEMIKVQSFINNENEGKVDLIEKLVGVYAQAYKKYQTDFIESIKVPLYIISGRIIQNYQLGLGISADLATNQVVFKAEGMQEDIFNILSVGQLNGVMLSILFSVRKIFFSESGLNLVLIDDPLQSVDDISAHSFVDLLSDEFPDTQMIFSTHEEDKARLLKYKFGQVNRKSQNFNMQKEYLSATESG
ncbi:AAA family ATPase [Listeria booriae]|uniref:AAA family ATPase n=1 Tax=Listeria booriae TaxID=1552123 RepID=UPI001629AF19|nr:AAA family ATPase [Listeria booriae]MBC2080467.1 AAA family ATPase [Listeria booriae]